MEMISKKKLERILEVEECIRYYPPDMKKIQNPRDIFKDKGQIHKNREIDLYIHIPFCKNFCGFCPFNKYFYQENKVRSYISLIEKEIKTIKMLYNLNQLKIRTIWIGGGTPSDLSNETLEKLLKIIHKNFILDYIKEFTIEVKPVLKSLTESKIRLLHKYKVNRISLGVQSTNQKYLKILGRRYTFDEAFNTIRKIQQNNFILNVDMLYRLPGQTLSEVKRDANHIGSLEISHASWFPYIPYQGTPLAEKINRKVLPKRADKFQYFKMFNIILERMICNGYQQYTPYYFSKGKKCQYHIDRWQMPQLETLGIGAGAFSFFNGWIYANAHNILHYLKLINNNSPPIIIGKKLNSIEKIARLAVLGIKFFTIDMNEFKKYSKIEMNVFYEKELKMLKRLGLIYIVKNKINCTPLGKAFNNNISMLFSKKQIKRQPQGIYLMKKIKI